MSQLSRPLFKFLKDLKANNERAWFDENRERYELDVRGPALQFIEDFGPRLHKISPHFRAEAKKVGGSLFRIHRDTRFSKDKTPYKNNTGLHFRHEVGKDAHAPGFYLHLEPGKCFVGAGIWRPDTASARAIREAIIERPSDWKKATQRAAFTKVLHLTGDALKRPPSGVDKEHPFIDDIKRKDFIACADIKDAVVTKPDFAKELARMFKAGAPLTKFLCEALGVLF